MSRRGASSSTPMRRPRLPDAIGEYPLGKHTGLPLIICDRCGQQRVDLGVLPLANVTLQVGYTVTQTNKNGNKGRIFFKCPRNMQGVPGSCGFYEWQRDYLAKLVDMGKIVMVLEEHVGREEVSDSKAVVAVQKNSMEIKLDALVGAVKGLCFVMGAGVLVGAMYVMK